MVSATRVYLSHDASSWTEVTSSVAAGGGLGASWNRGRSRVQGEWLPGSASLTFRNRLRAVDPSNDNATFQPRPGDAVRIDVGADEHWHGWLDAITVAYVKAGDVPNSTLRMACTDGLATLGRVYPNDVHDEATTGGGRFQTILEFSDVSYPWDWDIDEGDETPLVHAPAGWSGTSALAAIQELTHAEGGDSALFVKKDGTLFWTAACVVPSTMVTFGDNGIAVTDVIVDYTDDEWTTRATVTTPFFYDLTGTSSTSLSTGTGSKTFDVDTPPYVAAYPGVNVTLDSSGSSASMTGITTSYDPLLGQVVAAITSITGSGSHSDWTLSFSQGENVTTSSATSLAVGTGSKVFVIDGSNVVTVYAGMPVTLDSIGSDDGMVGKVTGYAPATQTVTAEMDSYTGSGSSSDWSVTFTATATNDAAESFFNNRRESTIGPLKGMSGTSGPMSGADRARDIVAEYADPSRRVSSFSVELGNLSSGNQTTVLGLEIGDAALIEVDLGTGDPQYVSQMRRIDGISHDVTDYAQHRMTFTLGREVWMNYTPTLTNASTGNGVLTGRYTKQGRTVNFDVILQFGSTTAVSGLARITVPVPRITLAGASVRVQFTDASAGAAGLYTGIGKWASSTEIDLYAVVTNSGTYAPSAATSSTIPFTWTTSDELIVTGTYEAAT